MQARVKPSNRYGAVIAFSGREYVKYEWRPAPAEFEAEALRHLSLEMKEQSQPAEVEEKPQGEKAEKVAKKARGKQ